MVHIDSAAVAAPVSPVEAPAPDRLIGFMELWRDVWLCSVSKATLREKIKKDPSLAPMNLTGERSQRWWLLEARAEFKKRSTTKVVPVVKGDYKAPKAVP